MKKKSKVVIEEISIDDENECPMGLILGLIDGAKTIVELWNAESPGQVSWKKEWLDNARKVISDYVGKNDFSKNGNIYYDLKTTMGKMPKDFMFCSMKRHCCFSYSCEEYGSKNRSRYPKCPLKEVSND